MDRRRFLAAMLGGAVLDTDRLLWRPGAKLISIPSVSAYDGPYMLTPEIFAKLTLVTLEGALRLSAQMNRAYERSYGHTNVHTSRW